jgi:ribonuclease PH
MNHKMDIVEVQGTAEAGSFSRQQLNQMLDFSEQGIQELLTAQRNAISDWNTLFVAT